MLWLRKIAFPISLIYSLVVHVRNYLYDTGFFKSKKYGTPTVCVGNLSVGGTGKTPMVEYLVRGFDKTFKIAVLSRGYGRKSNGYHLANTTSTVRDLGDEPYQIFKKFNTIDLAVDANRQNGIENLEATVAPELIILDDAFQHRKVVPMFNILLTAYDNLYPKDYYLPTGDLRDAKNQVRRAHIVVVTKCPETLDANQRQKVLTTLDLNKKVLFAKLVYDTLFSSVNESLSMAELEGKDIAVVTGIADPRPFLSHLKGLGLNFTHYGYRDHHFFSDKEVAIFKKHALVLTTEKDYVRLGVHLKKCYYLGVRHEFFENGATILENEIQSSIKRYRQLWS